MLLMASAAASRTLASLSSRASRNDGKISLPSGPSSLSSFAARSRSHRVWAVNSSRLAIAQHDHLLLVFLGGEEQGRGLFRGRNQKPNSISENPQLAAQAFPPRNFHGGMRDSTAGILPTDVAEGRFLDLALV